jgi:hypothetical protein
MWAAALVTIALAAANQSMASGLDLCLENRARLDDDTVRAFRTELERIVAASDRPAAFVPCGSGTITITFRNDPPGEEPTALGSIRQVDGRLIQQIELYVQPTAAVIGTRLPAVLGRALARVGTHELGHWLSQASGHAQSGIMMESLSAAHLMVPDRGRFRLPPGN